MLSNPLIRLRGVSKSYPLRFGDMVVELGSVLLGRRSALQLPVSGKTAVDNLTVEILPGERVGIIGPNGAGKSTLVHLIAGLAAPTRGAVEVTGRVTAVMTLGVGLREDFSGRENIYIDGELQGKQRVEVDRLVEQIIEFAELREFIDMPLRTYSTGMKARLAFAMISCIEPEILVIDEALSVGDAFFAMKAQQKIRELCDAGRIVIVVSHEIDSIRRMCTRCLWMESGAIVMDGDPVATTRAYTERVKAQDESLLLERLPVAAKQVTLADGIESLELSLRYSGEQEARRLVESGREAAFAISARATRALNRPSVRFALLRLDGIVLMESTHDVFDHPAREGAALACRATVELGPLRLNRGAYVGKVELREDGSPVAARTLAFEVAASEVPRGGTPLLLWPCTVRSQRI